MNHNKYSRRGIFKTLGLGAGLLPLLEARSTYAQSAAFPRRFIVLVQTNGASTTGWWPTFEGGNLKGKTLPEATSPLNAHLEDVTIVDGIELKNFTDYPNHGAGHENFSTILTGAKGYEVQDGGARFTGGSPTLDQYIATELAKTKPLPIRSLTLGCNNFGRYWHQTRCFYTGPDTPITPEHDPARTYMTVFGGRQLPGGEEDPVLKKLRARRKSLLDHVGKELESFATRLGTEDRMRVGAHLQSVREVERQLDALAGNNTACKAPTAPMPGANYPAVLTANLDLALAAFRCDLTRVVGVQLTSGNGSELVMPWIGLEGKGQEFSVRNHHDVSHRPGPQDADKIKAEKWFMEQLASLLTKLKSTPEGGGTMLDNTLVLWVNHMGNGGAHNSNRLPFIVGGGRNGGMKLGQLLKVNRAPTNGVYVAICQAMGLQVETFADARYGGALSGLI